ncbi:DUF3850 domain-containing protein [Thomasclavelia cocleata]|uniref:DUF3850 domain-containing protein n=1 Tax=Thomasclavelia cocleata TaxID=69824 RepID=UPI002432BC47|nr:DUF3850 domain-containing protein [Thomasclavelia cocleata]
MRIINLKTKPQYFELQLQDKKNFEIRHNDRNFKVGDILCLEEYNKDYTGRFIHVEVTCIIEDYCRGGYVTLGTKKRLDLGVQITQ